MEIIVCVCFLHCHRYFFSFLEEGGSYEINTSVPMENVMMTQENHITMHKGIRRW